MKTNSRLIYVIALVAAVAVAVAACSPAAGSAKTMYHCPMHPDYVSDKPGDCPICGMRLVPIEKGTKPPSRTGLAAPEKHADAVPAVDHKTGKVVWTCPMHPEVQQDKPGECPKCGMDLEKKIVGAEPAPPSKTPDSPNTPAVAPAAMQQAQMPDMPGMPATPPAPQSSQPSGHQHGTAPPSAGGLAPIHEDAAVTRLAGVRTIAATTGTLAGTVRAVGTVVMPETGVRQVTTKVAGWVQKLYVNSTGRPVRAGEPLFELYSPELLASQEEYLRARQVAAQFSKSTLSEVQSGGRDLAEAARRRLELFDVPPEFIRHLEDSGKAQRTVTFRAPFSGYVTEKTVVEGQRIEPGMNLMTIADLSRAWVTAQVYEAEASVARQGRTARVSLPYEETTRLTGRVDLVYPTVDPESRTIKLRLQFPNPKLVLKPGMFVNVELDAERGQGVVVPDSAVIDTGARQVVFVATDAGHFEPRDVQVGLRSNGQALLRAGVKAGEQVAVSANFLLDSESRLRAAMGAATQRK